jgi:hypothetical protein
LLRRFLETFWQWTANREEIIKLRAKTQGFAD